MAGSSSRRSKRLSRRSSGGVPWNIDEGNQNVMVDSLSSNDFVSPPIVLAPRAQPDPPLDDSDDGLAVEEVGLFHPMKIRGNPKHLVSPIKRFNACQKRVVYEIELGDILHLQTSVVLCFS
nr:beta-D-glucosyl crocetin beta-1,6-glucosyltransferase-like [Ipomoea trifida]